MFGSAWLFLALQQLEQSTQQGCLDLGSGTHSVAFKKGARNSVGLVQLPASLLGSLGGRERGYLQEGCLVLMRCLPRVYMRAGSFWEKIIMGTRPLGFYGQSRDLQVMSMVWRTSGPQVYIFPGYPGKDIQGQQLLFTDAVTRLAVNR